MLREVLLFCSICSSFLLVSMVVEAVVFCPPAAAYAPCKCQEFNDFTEDSGTIKIDCSFQSVDDVRVSEVLDAFLTTPNVSPVEKLDLEYNKLTRVPLKVHNKFFPKLLTVLLSSNQITSVDATEVFDFTENLSGLFLYQNQLTTIAPGAFKENDNDRIVRIDLDGNSLTRFEATVFQSVPFGGPLGNRTTFVDIKDNPFDCDCHLAWLIRDNRELLPYLEDTGTCSNGTTFEDLDPNGFADCASFMCPLGYDGYYADPLTCSSYYNCSLNIAYSYECSTGLLFNPETKRCADDVVLPNCQHSNSASSLYSIIPLWLLSIVIFKTVICNNKN